jgi:hypothetical protein
VAAGFISCLFCHIIRTTTLIFKLNFYCMKKLINLSLLILAVTIVFNSCSGDDDVVLNVPGDVTLNLGATTFDPMEGVTVSGARLNDVVWNAAPAWDPHKVNHYVFTYSVGGATEDRNVYIQVDNLVRTYQVTDRETGGGSFGPYPVQVTKGPEYNTLRFNELYYDDIVVNATVQGEVITIPEQQFFGNQVRISGTGTYDGEAARIRTINYTIEESMSTTTGVSTFE